MSIERRGFLQGTLLSGTALIAGGVVPQSASAEPDEPQLIDFTEGSAALDPDKVVRSACQFCNSLCGLDVGVKAGRVIDVRGFADDPVQDGKICVKGPMMVQLSYNPLRLTTPLVRTGGAKGSPESTFKEATWDEALDVIAKKWLQLRDAGEARSIANRTTGRLPRGTGSLAARLFALLGSPNNTDVGPVCNDAGGNALAATFGMGNFTNGYGRDGATGKEDLGSAEYLLFLGTNQAETHPVTFDYLLRGRARTKARLVVVDPRRTATGARADEWIAPKPHTDFAFALGMLSHVITGGLYDKAFVGRWVLGFDELRDHLAGHGYTPEWAAKICDIPAGTIRRVAEEYARAKPAAIFCNAGISHQLGAFDTYRVLAFLTAVTGNIGRLGGGANFMHNTWPGDLHLPALTVTTPERGTALPVGPDHFAGSILHGRPYRLRAVMTEGNPLLSSANTAQVRQAYEQLEFYVYTGLFMEEAAYYADVILPVTGGLEIDGVYMRRDDRAIRWQERALEPVGQSRPDWHIWIDLAHALGRNDTRKPASYWTDAFPLTWKDYSNLWAEFVKLTPAMGGMTERRMRARREPLRWPCPSERHPGVSALYLDHPSWYEVTAALGAKGRRFLTPSGKVEIHTPELDARLKTAGHSALPVFYTHPEVTGAHPTIAYQDAYVANPINPGAVTQRVTVGVPGNGAVHRQYPLMGMTGRPSVVHFASVTHWTYTGEQQNGVRLIQIHPSTAKKYGIGDGDDIVIESPRGSAGGTALLWEGIRTDTVFLPNTFGPAQRVGDIFGGPRYEPANMLVDDQFYDNLSGQQAYKCFACRIRKA
ncbi:molybdopterin-dependent oxidoreductase [Microbispora sp. RL4-1S]|uniref:Molybdopterin-dependent oxidoreductase n=1 Tax=Microbispora oryzae TaxID=2806554 RepID=A0A941AHM4_9ACTN|nr:molybdopterin-dependent oxidoreductase [Microbispora oryzae]MBP2704246.1 molybdopterin-dependent oxidoreductase [Microbispora oryzae]